MKNINIPEPCSENWNEMTPNDKGAFCQKCVKDVYDFTNKSSDEIRDVLARNISKPVCMRIESTQLVELNNDFSAWKMDNKASFQRAWVFSLLVVFGMTLFSCEEDDEALVEKFQKVGQVILTQQKPNEVLEVEKTQKNVIDKKTQESELVIPETLELDERIEYLGELAYEEPFIAAEQEEVVFVERQDVIHRTYATAGVPMISRDYNEYLIETTQGDEVAVELNEIEEITGLVYPNPAANQTTLQLNMPKRGKGQIELFAMSGQKIRTIHTGRLKKGESEFAIDLTDLEMGMYLVVIYSGEMKETVKFSKI